MSNLKANVIEGLRSEREGLEARLSALGDAEGPPGQRAMLERRIGEIDEQLGGKPAAAKERRPARKPAEKRPE
jgi:hypothetical protein